MKVCISCNKTLTNDYVEFKCPKCLEQRIVRCLDCRQKSMKYKCPACGFEGP